jgi:hypothetical protein
MALQLEAAMRIRAFLDNHFAACLILNTVAVFGLLSAALFN